MIATNSNLLHCLHLFKPGLRSALFPGSPEGPAGRWRRTQRAGPGPPDQGGRLPARRGLGPRPVDSGGTRGRRRRQLLPALGGAHQSLLLQQRAPQAQATLQCHPAAPQRTDHLDLRLLIRNTRREKACLHPASKMTSFFVTGCLFCTH